MSDDRWRLRCVRTNEAGTYLLEHRKVYRGLYVGLMRDRGRRAKRGTRGTRDSMAEALYADYVMIRSNKYGDMIAA